LPFRDNLSHLRDIDSSIDLIQAFIGNKDFDTFGADRKTVAAVERMLQIISEAAIRLGDEAERLCPGQPWRNIRGLGNWIRHQYDDLDREIIWNTIKEDLPRLKGAVSRAISDLERSPDT
jgi:uncharacterized protein with HEPN domain